MNYLLYGKPGAGKTTAALTNPNKPLYLFDIDNKASKMMHMKPLIDSGSVIIRPFSEPLILDTLRWRASNPDQAMKKEPQGYLLAVDLLSDMLEGKDEVFNKCGGLILDSVTRLLEHMKRLLIYHRGQGRLGKKDDRKSDGDMNWPSWGSYLSNLEELFTALITLQDKDLIVIAHESIEEERDAKGNVVAITGIWPAVDGAMKKKLAGYFDEVYYLEPKITGKSSEYRFRTRGGVYCCRSSLGLDVHEPSNIEHCLKKGGVSWT